MPPISRTTGGPLPVPAAVVSCRLAGPEPKLVKKAIFMAKTSACPELSHFKKLATGQLSPTEKESVLDHLEECAGCVQHTGEGRFRDITINDLSPKTGAP